MDNSKEHVEIVIKKKNLKMNQIKQSFEFSHQKNNKRIYPTLIPAWKTQDFVAFSKYTILKPAKMIT